MLNPEQRDDEEPMYPDMPRMGEEEDSDEGYDDSRWSTGDADDYY